MGELTDKEILSTEDIVDYVIQSPQNTNPNILRGMVNTLVEEATGNALPDPSEASAGDVLALNEDKEPEWITKQSGIRQYRDGNIGEVLFRMGDNVGYWQSAVQKLPFAEQYLGSNKYYACNTITLAKLKQNISMAGYLPIAEVINGTETESQFWPLRSIKNNNIYFYSPSTNIEYVVESIIYNDVEYMILISTTPQ